MDKPPITLPITYPFASRACMPSMGTDQPVMPHFLGLIGTGGSWLDSRRPRGWRYASGRPAVRNDPRRWQPNATTFLMPSAGLAAAGVGRHSSVLPEEIAKGSVE